MSTPIFVNNNQPSQTESKLQTQNENTFLLFVSEKNCGAMYFLHPILFNERQAIRKRKEDDEKKANG